MATKVQLQKRIDYLELKLEHTEANFDKAVEKYLKQGYTIDEICDSARRIHKGTLAYIKKQRAL